MIDPYETLLESPSIEPSGVFDVELLVEGMDAGISLWT